jgi:hypothetical protein
MCLPGGSFPSRFQTQIECVFLVFPLRNIDVSKYMNFSQVTLNKSKIYFVCAGYGNLAPHSKVWKVTTTIYAIIGMPLFLLYLSIIGDIFARSFKWTYDKCCLCQGSCKGLSRRRSARRQQLALSWEMTSGG